MKVIKLNDTNIKDILEKLNKLNFSKIEVYQTKPFDIHKTGANDIDFELLRCRNIKTIESTISGMSIYAVDANGGDTTYIATVGDKLYLDDDGVTLAVDSKYNTKGLLIINKVVLSK